MTKSTLNQLEKQNEILDKLNLDPIAFSKIGYAWWQNPTNKNSLRLTSVGHKWFTNVAKLTGYTIDIPKEEKIMPRQLLQLERLFTEPYYIKTLNTIVVFGEQDAVMLQLHSGNLTAYLDSLQANQ